MKMKRMRQSDCSVLKNWLQKLLWRSKPRRIDADATGVQETSLSQRQAVKFSEEVLDRFRGDVGRLPAETGGMLASSKDERVIDQCHFDRHSKNTPGSFYYDVESMSKKFCQWQERGYITNGIYHSHPQGMIRPS